MIDKLTKLWRDWDEPIFWKIVGAWMLAMIVWGMIVITVIAAIIMSSLINHFLGTVG